VYVAAKSLMFYLIKSEFKETSLL